MSGWLEEELRAVHPALVPAPGLQALAPADRERIDVESPRVLEGSCDIDGCLVDAHPRAPRWDYVVAARGGAWFVEVHPAGSTGNVDEVVAKAKWLRSSFGASALLRPAPPGRCRGLYWIASGRVTPQLQFSRQRRLLALAGVDGPRSRLRLPPE